MQPRKAFPSPPVVEVTANHFATGNSREAVILCALWCGVEVSVRMDRPAASKGLTVPPDLKSKQIALQQTTIEKSFLCVLHCTVSVQMDMQPRKAFLSPPLFEVAENHIATGAYAAWSSFCVLCY